MFYAADLSYENQWMVYVSARKFLGYFILFAEDVCTPLNRTLSSAETTQQGQEGPGCVIRVANKV